MYPLKTLLLSLLLSGFQSVFADEGMLLPLLLKAFESDMKARGMKLTAEDIYSVNQASLKDAILQFGGGCTAELVSSQGLLLTNHHCGYSQIQSHSSLEHDYLKNGYWARNRDEELPNPGLTAMRIVRIEDVTEAMLQGTKGKQDKQGIDANMKQWVEKTKAGSHYEVEIKAFDYGNAYYMMVKEVFLDVRFVGTPPNSIGKFGGDTDNWVWPRHTGDFSVFRIYVGKDNKPAPYSKENVPYAPLKHLSISFKERKEGDFTMVYGFPGLTEQHVVSEYLKFIIEKERPARIAMRDLSLAVIDEGMRSSDLTRIQYSAKQASIANAWKKWIGQVEGLKNLDGFAVKQREEAAYRKMAETKAEWKKYADVLDRLNELIKAKKNAEFDYAMGVEYFYYGPEYFKLVRGMEELILNYEKYLEKGELKQVIEKMKSSADLFFKNYNAQVDKGIYKNQTNAYFKYTNQWAAITKNVKYSVTAAWFESYVQSKADIIYGQSIFTDKARYIAFLDGFSAKSLKKLNKDLGYTFFNQYFAPFRNESTMGYRNFQREVSSLMQLYVEGKYVMFPNEKHWPDANSTLRITYGQLEGSAPIDGMAYTEHTTLNGMIAKNKTGNPDFELAPRMIQLAADKTYGPYGQDGELWVCFTGSNHTTGGNSGSPVLDDQGHLMGLNFDRTWESTMSDYLFDPSRCRNVVVDIRYVLWVMDIYAGASHLVKEMTLVR